MAVDKKAYMHAYNRDPEKIARRKISAQKYRSRPEIRAKLAAKKRKKNATEKGKQQAHARTLKFNYGITLAEYTEMYLVQGGVCAICKRPPSASARYKNLCVDHCHDTDAIRGLLCGDCNLAIGMFKDSPSLLDAAAVYLRRCKR